MPAAVASSVIGFEPVLTSAAQTMLVTSGGKCFWGRGDHRQTVQLTARLPFI